MLNAATIYAQAAELGFTQAQVKSLTQDKKIALLHAVSMAQIAASLAALESQVLAASTAPTTV